MMGPSRMLEKEHEEMIALCQRLTPEERLMAFFHHSQLVHQMYRAGVRYRAGTLPSSKKPRGRHR